MKKINILFDLDGTLIDSTQAILESFAVAYSAMKQQKPTDATIKAQIGYPLDNMFRSFGIQESLIADFVYHYKMHYQQIHTLKTLLLPHAKEAIAEASKIANLGIVTTKTSKYSIELLNFLGVYEYFDTLIGREDVEHPKPHPEPINKALYTLKQNAPTWMIGDTCLDMLSAKAAHINSIGVLCGYSTQKELESCTATIKSNALEAILEIKEQLTQ